ncbi:hypothetical protein OH76DRAFT_1003277 [Lentinus brumalis]|uniref:Uncharacterized protein n=1 Tax=Lentinus brumalis TaxID=2498619 RepID=A0A371CYF4_9APHY|nr:hypothetical protein OH76DRAFT_1003277 [Polyporus brumalis]
MNRERTDHREVRPPDSETRPESPVGYLDHYQHDSRTSTARSPSVPRPLPTPSPDERQREKEEEGGRGGRRGGGSKENVTTTLARRRGHAAELRRASSVASPGSRLPERGNARWHASSLRRPSGSLRAIHAHTTSLTACVQLGRPDSTQLGRSCAHQPVILQNSCTALSLNTALKRVARTGNSAKKRPKDASLCRNPGGSEWAGAVARREPSETRCVRAPSPLPN